MEDDVLVSRVLEVLAARTGWAWRPSGPPYTADEVGLHYGELPATPDRGVGVTLYDATDVVISDPFGAPAARRVQLRFRGAQHDRAGADRLASQAFRALQGLSRVAGLNHAERTVMAQLGTDDNARTERADSYLIVPDTEA